MLPAPHNICITTRCHSTVLNDGAPVRGEREHRESENERLVGGLAERLGADDRAHDGVACDEPHTTEDILSVFSRNLCSAIRNEAQ